MFADLDIFRTAQSMAAHAGKRQSIIAQNIANADTPGYKPSDITSFSQLVAHSSITGRSDLDLLGARLSRLEAQEVHGGPESPNGNGVSLELEMVKSAETQRQHDRALFQGVALDQPCQFSANHVCPPNIIKTSVTLNVLGSSPHSRA
jgi:flagellar basal-body rod protein FlgB